MAFKTQSPNRGRKPGSKVNKTDAVPYQLQNFDKLPNSAHVRLPVVAGLYGVCGSTVWRRIQAGAIPAPKELGPNTRAWNVGELRKALGLNGGA